MDGHHSTRVALCLERSAAQIHLAYASRVNGGWRLERSRTRAPSQRSSAARARQLPTDVLVDRSGRAQMRSRGCQSAAWCDFVVYVPGRPLVVQRLTCDECGRLGRARATTPPLPRVAPILERVA